MKYWDPSVSLSQKLHIFATQQIPVLATFPSDPQFFTRLEEAPHNFFAKLGVLRQGKWCASHQMKFFCYFFVLFSFLLTWLLNHHGEIGTKTSHVTLNEFKWTVNLKWKLSLLSDGSRQMFFIQIFQAVHGAGADLHGLTFLTTLLHPRSVGQIRLKSKDPLDPPVIDPNYLDDPEDVEHLLYGTD